MLPFNSLKEIIASRKKKPADILTEKMIDNSLRSQDDSGSSEFDVEEKLNTTKSNEIIEFIQNSQEFIRDLVRGKDATFNRYSDRLKALRCLTKREAEETALS